MKLKRILTCLLIFVLSLMMLPTVAFATTEYLLQKSTVKCSVVYAFSVNGATESTSCRAAPGDSITGKVTVTPNSGYEFDRIVFSDNWDADGNITVGDFVITEKSGNVISFSFTMPGKPTTGSNMLLFSVRCVLPTPPVPVPSIALSSTSNTLEYDSNNVRYTATVKNTMDQSVLKTGTVQYYLNDIAIVAPVSYSTEHNGYSIAIRSWNNNDGIPYFKMGENKVYAVYTYTDNTTTVTSSMQVFTLAKKDVSSSISSGNVVNSVYDGTEGKSRVQFSLLNSIPESITFEDFIVTATKNGEKYIPIYELDYDHTFIRVLVPDSGDYVFTVTLQDAVENYKATKTRSITVKKREITLKPADKTATINSTLTPSCEVSAGTLATGDEITNVVYAANNTSTLGTSEMEISSYKLANSENCTVTLSPGTLIVLDFSDYTKVDEAIAKADALKTDDYKDFSAVTNAINAVVRDKYITEQATVNGYAVAIEDAINALELKGADYTKVDEAIAKADALKTDDYKDFSAVTNAINAVVRDKNITEQATVNGYAVAIEDAINALELKGADYTKVDEAIAKADALKTDDYKDFSAVTNAINAVVRDKYITEQATVKWLCHGN